jgi:Protein of unknown function (DUF3263).
VSRSRVPPRSRRRSPSRRRCPSAHRRPTPRRRTYRAARRTTPGPPTAGPGRPEADRGSALTDREREILAFERRWWRHAGAKEQAIRDTFDISATRYYQILNRLLDNPAALAAEPVLVARLRRLRAARSRGRGR